MQWFVNLFKGGRKDRLRGTPTDAENFLSNPPMLLIIGSISDCSRKDVLAYARGLAESQVIAKESCFIGAVKIGSSWIYEIHEGGPGKSIALWIKDCLQASPDTSILLPIAGERVVSVSDIGGDLITIVYPPSPEKLQSAISQSQSLALGGVLMPFFGSAALFRNAAGGLLAVSIFLFLFSGTILYSGTHAIDLKRFTDSYAASNHKLRTDVNNLPSIQLDIAAKNINPGAGYLSYLQLQQGRWTWAQSSSSAP